MFFLCSGRVKGAVGFSAPLHGGYMVRTGHAQELYDSDVEYQFQNRLAGPLEYDPAI